MPATWNSAERRRESAPPTAPRAPEYGAETPVETTTEARQGVTGHNVRYVLLVGTGGVVLAFALIYAAFFA